jgi:CRP-like cAMP-binding protein
VKWLDVKRGVLLQQEGTAMHGLYFIKSGQVSVLMRPMPSEEKGRLHSAVLSSTQKRLLGLPAGQVKPLAHPMRQVALLGARDYFGEDAFVCGGMHQVSEAASSGISWIRKSMTLKMFRTFCSHDCHNACCFTSLL